MVERIEDCRSDIVSVGTLFNKVRSEYNVSIEVDGNSVVINGDNNLMVLRAKEAISGLLELSDKNEIDPMLVDYVIFLENTGKLEEFLQMKDEVFFTTYSGRPLKAKTLGQRFYIDALKRSELVICSGPAGSGKTFLGVAMAVKAFRNKEVSRIILTRPAVEAGEKLGFLPGDIAEKVNPYMRPIYDALIALLGQENFEKYYDKGLIEVSPLAFMRGRNLDDAYVLLDEAQNTTVDQMMMFLTRLGMNCRACVCGDFTQIDLPRGVVSGLYDSMDVLKGVDGVSLISLGEADIVRNPLVQRIVRAYADREKSKTEDS
ncbi:MAG: PhoH family protein [Clostridiales bacterium]|nr:PhoH family protein [Clostridiales bacterium]